MRTTLLLVLFFLANPAPAAETAAELLKKSLAALAKGQAEESLALAGKAIALDPKASASYFVRGTIHERLGQNAQAVADFTKVIQLDPKAAGAYNRRGSEQFRQGNIAESLKDFDKHLELRPQDRAGHWKRGISCYYLGRFEDGKKQFEGYEKVDTNDVENAVWHFLCAARLVGVDKARASILKIGKDTRVPMMEVYALYAGKAKPADVLTAAKAGDPTAAQLNARLFYAHQYLGLYAEGAATRKRPWST